MTFDEAYAQFPLRIKDQYEAALAQVKAWGSNVPKSVAEWLKLFLPGLVRVGKKIDALIATIPRQPRTPEEAQRIGKAWQLKNLFNGVWAPLYDDTIVTDGPGFPEFGFLPVLAVAVAGVGFVGLTAVGLAWAIVADKYVGVMDKEVDVEMAEVKARDDAAKGGYQLQQNTLRPKPPPAPPGDGPGWWPVAAVAALGVAVMAFGGGRS